MPARIDDLLVLNANLNKSDFAKYLRDREAVLPNDFGGPRTTVRPGRHFVPCRKRWCGTRCH